jgi:hypothetical protein
MRVDEDSHATRSSLPVSRPGSRPAARLAARPTSADHRSLAVLNAGMDQRSLPARNKLVFPKLGHHTSMIDRLGVPVLASLLASVMNSHCGVPFS